MYNDAMTSKAKKAKGKKKRARPRRIGRMQASVEDDLLLLGDETAEGEARWSRPRKKRISLRVDLEVLDWFQSKGAGYQTRINRILRNVMIEGKKRGRQR
jgi:uncharacterized protein (DUF4415 family)